MTVVLHVEPGRLRSLEDGKSNAHAGLFVAEIAPRRGFGSDGIHRIAAVVGRWLELADCLVHSQRQARVSAAVFMRGSAFKYKVFVACSEMVPGRNRIVPIFIRGGKDDGSFFR